jgi:hypothetical protein
MKLVDADVPLLPVSPHDWDETFAHSMTPTVFAVSTCPLTEGAVAGSQYVISDVWKPARMPVEAVP